MRNTREVSLAELVIGGLLALVGGLFLGVITTFKHRVGLTGTPSLPTGLVLGVLLIGFGLLAVRLLTGTRLYALIAGIGVVGAIFVLSLEGPGGSVVIVDDAAGTAWLIAPAVVAAAVVLIPAPRRRRRPDGILES